VKEKNGNDLQYAFRGKIFEKGEGRDKGKE